MFLDVGRVGMGDILRKCFSGALVMLSFPKGFFFFFFMLRVTAIGENRACGKECTSVLGFALSISPNEFDFQQDVSNHLDCFSIWGFCQLVEIYVYELAGV